MTPALIAFLIAALIASVTDIRSRRIPNSLTCGAIALAIGLHALEGPASAAFALLAAAGVIVAGSFAHRAGWFGGGDVKLLAAGAAAVSFPSFIVVFLVIGVAGGIMALAAAVRDRRLVSILTNAGQSAVLRTGFTPLPGSRRLPYAVAIFAGTCYYAASGSIAPWLPLVH